MANKKPIIMKPFNKTHVYCYECQTSILNKWWILFKQRILCRKCYDKTIRPSTKTSR